MNEELKKEELSKVEIERKIIDSMLNKFEKTIKDEVRRELLRKVELLYEDCKTRLGFDFIKFEKGLKELKPQMLVITDVFKVKDNPEAFFKLAFGCSKEELEELKKKQENELKP